MRARLTLVQGLGIAFAALMIVGYPVIAAKALALWEPRTIALGIGVFALVVIGIRVAWGGGTSRGLVLQYGAGIALQLVVIITNDRLGLLLVPALVNLYLALGAGWTLTTERSLVERLATLIEPHLPEFTRSYCRKVTWLWALFFAGNALLIAGLAILGPESRWYFYTSQLYFGIVITFSGTEFLIRKTYFRNYGKGAVDRVFSSLFPAQNTEQGRRSQAYLQKMRKLGFKID